MTENATDQHLVRVQKLQALREAGVEPFAYSYSKTHDSAQLD